MTRLEAIKEGVENKPRYSEHIVIAKIDAVWLIERVEEMREAGQLALDSLANRDPQLRKLRAALVKLEE